MCTRYGLAGGTGITEAGTSQRLAFFSSLVRRTVQRPPAGGSSYRPPTTRREVVCIVRNKRFHVLRCTVGHLETFVIYMRCTAVLTLVVSAALLLCAGGMSYRGTDTGEFDIDAVIGEQEVSNLQRTRRGLAGGAQTHRPRGGWLHHQAASPNLVQELNKHRQGPNPHTEGYWLLLLLSSAGAFSWLGSRFGLCCTTRRHGQRRPVARGLRK